MNKYKQQKIKKNIYIYIYMYVYICTHPLYIYIYVHIQLLMCETNNFSLQDSSLPKALGSWMQQRIRPWKPW